MSTTLALLTAGAISEAGKRFGADVYESLKAAGSSAITVTREFLEIGFSDSISSNMERCSKVKTIINRYERVPLELIYEDCSLEFNGESFSESDVLLNPASGNIIISGTAGSGKSFLMKRTFTRMVEVNYGYVPIFFELRSLNNEDKPILLDSMFEFLSTSITGDAKLVQRMLQTGKFVFLLDGYDELYDKIRSRISLQIEKIITKFPRCRIIISGRPSDSFEGWAYFNVYHIEPLSKEGCLSLINKAIFPDEQKDKFHRSVNETIFYSHGEYLSNPLMTYVMMMTADRFIEFPKEMSAFYDKAFETLYAGHDILKSNDFLREVKCNLRMRELSKILQYFCAVSYSDSVFQYDYKSVIEYLDMALSVSKIDKSAEDVLDDLINAYCILIKDGTNYSYIHRSFQEYFAALGVSQSEKIDFRKYNSRVLRQYREIEGYFSLLSEISREKFVSGFIIWELKSYIEEVSVLIAKRPKEFLLKHIGEYGVGDSGDVRYIAFTTQYDRGNYALLVTVLPMVDARFSEKFFDLAENNVDAMISTAKGVVAHPPEEDRFMDVHAVFNIQSMLSKDVVVLNVFLFFKRRVADIKNYIRDVEREFSRDKSVIVSMRDKVFARQHGTDRR